MNIGTRVCVAYIAAATIDGRSVSSLYDHSRARHVIVSGQAAESVNIYDHDRGCHVFGSGSRGTYYLYDKGLGNYVQLHVFGNNFSGYDFASGKHFQGSISGAVVRLYDYEDSTWFRFTVSWINRSHRRG